MWKATEVVGDVSVLDDLPTFWTGYSSCPDDKDTWSGKELLRVSYAPFRGVRGGFPLAPSGEITALWRATDLPSLVESFVQLGIDPETVLVAHNRIIGAWHSFCASREDADKLRLKFAKQLGIGIHEAKKIVDSPYIGDDQRQMYQAVIKGGAG